MIETSNNETTDVTTRPRSYRISNEDIKNLGSFYCGQHEQKIQKYNEEINTLKQQLSELNEKMGKCYMPKHVEPGKLIETTFFYYFFKEMREIQDQVSADTKKKRKTLRNISQQCVKYINSKNKIKQKKLEEEEKRLKTLSKHVSVYIDLFWKRIETLVWEEKKRELQQTLNKKKEMRFKKFVKGAIKKIKKAKANATELFCNVQHQGSSNESTDDCNESVQTETTEDKVLREDDLTDQEEEDYLLDKQMQSDEEEKEEQKKEVSLLDDEANIPLEELLKNIYGFESGKEYIELMQQEETPESENDEADDEEDPEEDIEQGEDENGNRDVSVDEIEVEEENEKEYENENENDANENENENEEKDMKAEEINKQRKKIRKRETELINEEEETTKATKDETDITNMNCVISEEEEEEEEEEGNEAEDMKEQNDEWDNNTDENEVLKKTYSLRKRYRKKRGMNFETESMLKCKMQKQETSNKHKKQNMETMSNMEFDEEERIHEAKETINENGTEDKHYSDDNDDDDNNDADDDDTDNDDDDDDDDTDDGDDDDNNNNDYDNGNYNTNYNDDDDDDEDDDDDDDEEEEDNENEEANALLCNMNEKHLTHIPPLIKAKLRDYQHAGLHWLLHLYKNNINGILADEMGLGKTLQCISLLAYLAYYMDIWGPHLVVVPASILINWEIELKRFCPCFKILCYYGSQSERHRKRVESFNKENAFHVCISTYSTLVKDHIIFKRKNWKYIILDEAHNIKNFNTKRWNIILSLKKENCILITGTPLQNSLEELWSLLHFLMPNIFTSHLDFKEWFSDPLNLAVQKNKIHDSRELIMKLHTVIRPYILRRLKKNVEKEMPNKYEHIIKCKLTRRQKILYDEFINTTSVQNVLQKGNYLGLMNVLIQLRKVCNHCDLFANKYIETPFYFNIPIRFFVPKYFLLFEENYYRDFYLILFLHNEFVTYAETSVKKQCEEQQKKTKMQPTMWGLLNTNQFVSFFPKNGLSNHFSFPHVEMENDINTNAYINRNINGCLYNNEIAFRTGFNENCNGNYGSMNYSNMKYENMNYGNRNYGNENYGNRNYSNMNYDNRNCGNENCGNGNYNNGNYGNINYSNGNYGNRNYDNMNCSNMNSGNMNSDNMNSGNMNSDNINSGNMNSDNMNSGNMNYGNMYNGNKNYGNGNYDNMNHSNINHGNMNQDNMNCSNMNSGNMNYGNMCNGNMNYGNMNHGNMNYGNGNCGNMNSDNMNYGNMNHGNMNYGNINYGNINYGNMNSDNMNYDNMNYGNGNCYMNYSKNDTANNPMVKYTNEYNKESYLEENKFHCYPQEIDATNQVVLHSSLNAMRRNMMYNFINEDKYYSLMSNADMLVPKETKEYMNMPRDMLKYDEEFIEVLNYRYPIMEVHIEELKGYKNYYDYLYGTEKEIQMNSFENYNLKKSISKTCMDLGEGGVGGEVVAAEAEGGAGIGIGTITGTGIGGTKLANVSKTDLEEDTFYTNHYNMKVINKKTQYNDTLNEDSKLKAVMLNIKNNIWIQREIAKEKIKKEVEERNKKKIIFENPIFQMKNKRVPIYGKNLLYYIKKEFQIDKHIPYYVANQIQVTRDTVKESSPKDITQEIEIEAETKVEMQMEEEKDMEKEMKKIMEMEKEKKEKERQNKQYDSFWILSELFPNLKHFLKRHDKIINNFTLFNMPKVIAAEHHIDINVCSVNNTNKTEVIEKIKNASRVFHTAFLKQAIICPLNKDIALGSGKLYALQKLLDKCKKEGSKCLLFTQFIKMLDIFEIFLNHLNYTFVRLDGSTKVEQRQKIVAQFNNDKNVFLFISSTRSGSIGINLISANVVIFYDTDWNPAIDKQAMDRCHRIGQTKDVHVFRFVCEYTVEENIWKKLLQKRKLDNVCIDMGNFNSTGNNNNNNKNGNWDRHYDGSNDLINEATHLSTDSNANWFSNINTIKEVFINKTNNDEDEDIYKDRLLHEQVEQTEQSNFRFEKTLEHVEDKDDVTALRAVKKETQQEQVLDSKEFTDDKAEIHKVCKLTAYCFTFLTENPSESLRIQTEEMAMKIQIEMMNTGNGEFSFPASPEAKTESLSTQTMHNNVNGVITNVEHLYDRQPIESSRGRGRKGRRGRKPKIV